MEAGGAEIESFLLKGDDSAAGVGVKEAGGALFDECPGGGVGDPFVNMEREVVLVRKMRKEHYEKTEAEECEQEEGGGCFKDFLWYRGAGYSTEEYLVDGDDKDGDEEDRVEEPDEGLGDWDVEEAVECEAGDGEKR